jgi:hypothetical protein
MRREYLQALVLLAFSGLFVGTRYIGLTAQSLWLDEINLLRIARELHGFSNLFELIKTEPHPPVFFLMSAAWVNLAGTSEIGVRQFSVLWSSLFFIAAVAFAYKRFGFYQAVIVCSVLIGSFSVFDYAQDFRPYSFLMFVGTCALAALCWFMDKPYSNWRLATLLGVLVLAGLTHYSAILFIASVAVAFASRSIVFRQRSSFQGLLFSGIILLSIVPGLLWYRATSEALAPLVAASAARNVDWRDFASPVRAMVGFPGLLLLAVVPIALHGRRFCLDAKSITSRLIRDPFFMTCLTLIVAHYILITLSSVVQPKMMQNKNVIVAFPAFYLAFSRYLYLALPDVRSIGLVSVLGVFSFATYVVTGHPHHGESVFTPWREQVREAANLVLTEAGSRDIVLFGSVDMGGRWVQPTRIHIDAVQGGLGSLKSTGGGILPPPPSRRSTSESGESLERRRLLTRFVATVARSEADRLFVDLPHGQTLSKEEWEILRSAPVCVRQVDFVAQSVLVVSRRVEPERGDRDSCPK